MDFGWYGEADTAAAVGYLLARPDVDPGRIGVVGMSMGGEVAIGAIGTDERVRAVVAEGVTGRDLSDHGWLPGGVNGAIERGAEYVQYAATELLTGAPRPISLPDALRAAAPRPVLIIAGGTVWNETAAAEHYTEASGSNVAVWVVPGAGHTGGLATQPAEWESRVVAFLDAALVPRP